MEDQLLGSKATGALLGCPDVTPWWRESNVGGFMGRGTDISVITYIWIFFMYTCDMDILNACDMFYVVLYLWHMVIDDLGAWCRRELQVSVYIFWQKGGWMNYYSAMNKSKRLRCSWNMHAFITVLMAWTFSTNKRGKSRGLYLLTAFIIFWMTLPSRWRSRLSGFF